nr:SGNH family hydrolase [Jiella sonneratiae]
MLFGNGLDRGQPYRISPRYRITDPETPERRPARRTTRKAKPQNPAPKAAATAPDQTAAKPAVAAKKEDAKTILVVGDFLAASLANGLKDAYEDNPMVVVKAAANGSSGLVRQDHYDWSTQLAPLIEANDPAVLVMMIGSNDRQPFYGTDASLAVRSPEWNAEYQRRVDEIADIAAKQKVPLVWVGAPPFKFDRMSEDMVYFNDLYRQAAQRVSGEYVDVWEGFVDENDSFIYSGPSVDGQTVQLRNSDGITMTDAGNDKLAFFARKAIDRYVAADQTSEAPAPGARIDLPPIAGAATAVRSPPVSLDDPSLDGGEALLGGGSRAAGIDFEPSPRDKLVLIGRGTGHVDGRADDFAWNDKSSAVASDDKPVAFRGSIDLQKVRKEQGIKPPQEMPSILDAIMDDWSQDNSQAAGGAAQK